MHETGKRRGKKIRKEQRQRFKKVLTSITTGEAPIEQLMIGSKLTVLSSWTKIFQFSLFRRALQTGVQIHMLENPLLQEIFELEQQNDTRVIPSRATNKQRTKHLHKNRAQRQRMKLDFYAD